jgi:hypothetical protein
LDEPAILALFIEADPTLNESLVNVTLFIEADPTLNESLVNVTYVISILTPGELATCIGDRTPGLANFEPVGRCP